MAVFLVVSLRNIYGLPPFCKLAVLTPKWKSTALIYPAYFGARWGSGPDVFRSQTASLPTRFEINHIPYQALVCVSSNPFCINPSDSQSLAGSSFRYTAVTACPAKLRT
jgi:hypothetical protein